MIRTTVVGSYPSPSWLAGARTREALTDAILSVLKTQELAGIDVVSDGELARFDVNHPDTNGMIDYFLAPLDGVDPRPTRADIVEFQKTRVSRYRREPAAILRGPLGEGHLNLPRDWKLIRDLTDRPMKFTVTGPHMLSKVLVDHYYRDPARLAMEIAAVLRRQIAAIDAAIIQVDEANIPGAPDEGVWAAAAINHVLAGVQGEKAVHVCFGNYGGQTVQEGHWQKLLEFLNALEADHLVLECARRPPEEVAALRDVREEVALGIGIIDIKDNEVESAEDVARRIEETASAVGGAGRIRYVHPDCGFWMLSRSIADRKMRALVAGRDLFEGRRS